MVHAVCVNGKILVAGKFEGLLRLPDLLELDLKGKLRCDYPKRIHHFLKTSWSRHQEGLRSLGIAHCQKKTGQSADMICVIVSKKDQVNGLRAPSFAPERYLSSLAAVDQDTPAVVADHQRCQIAVRKGHHPARSKKTNINHIYLIYFLRHIMRASSTGLS